MDEALRQAYLDTEYLVCVDTTEWARIRVDQALPDSLQLKVGANSWGFITAWNPLSEARSPAENLTAQRELFTCLQAAPETLIFAALGIGSNGWHEPSLFVIGPDQSTLDVLGHRYRQHAYVCGKGTEAALLRILSG